MTIRNTLIVAGFGLCGWFGMGLAMARAIVNQ
jgi:hypothetical protein